MAVTIESERRIAWEGGREVMKGVHERGERGKGCCWRCGDDARDKACDRGDGRVLTSTASKVNVRYKSYDEAPRLGQF
jgi:hypothetical protein